VPYLAFILSLVPITLSPLEGSSGSPIRQHAYVDTAIEQAMASQPGSYTLGTDIQGDDAIKADDRLQQVPYCFIADTDSVPYILDTGANRVILNDAKLFKEFQPSTGSVKGIEGDPVTLGGVGSPRLPLKSDNGKVDYVDVDDAVYVPTSPYNSVPPQIIINKLKKQGYYVQCSEHDDHKYMFRYNPLSDAKTERTITVPIRRNHLFTMRLNEGYTSFFQQASHFDPEWGLFAGAAHVIPEEPDDIPRESTINQGPDKPRESPAPPQTSQEPDKLREYTEPPPDRIPFTDADFYEQVKDKPAETNFDVDDKPSELEDPLVAMVKRKQSRLVAIHERLGHLSYARLKLMARAGLIPIDLANVDPPMCPGCAYGKAHQLPWRHNGIHNHMKLRTATVRIYVG
jgi:hypothetical protein